MRSMELLADLAACVQQLAENALDAKASWVEVRVDCSKFVVEVTDGAFWYRVMLCKPPGGCKIAHYVYQPTSYALFARLPH